MDRAHQRVDVHQPQRLAVVLLRRRRAVGIERRRAAVVAAAVEHPVGGRGMPSALQGVRLQALVEQHPRHLVAVDAHLCLDSLQAAVDHLPLAAHRPGQILHRTLLQVVELGIADRRVGQQVHGDQYRLHQDQRNQRALHEGAPDPLAQGIAGRFRHERPRCRRQRPQS
ncbi:hypothetical protein D9M70_371810 [compost metagenome]